MQCRLAGQIEHAALEHVPSLGRGELTTNSVRDDLGLEIGLKASNWPPILKEATKAQGRAFGRVVHPQVTGGSIITVKVDYGPGANCKSGPKEFEKRPENPRLLYHRNNHPSPSTVASGA
jgi:hypothetical protein